MAETPIGKLRSVLETYGDVFLVSPNTATFEQRIHVAEALRREAAAALPHLLAVVEAAEKAWPHMFEELRASSKVAKKRAYEKVYAALGPLFEELPDD